jgi:4,5-dihydroxyphthalate decarboxylase
VVTIVDRLIYVRIEKDIDMALDLTLACGEYDLTSALASGEVQPDGVDLETLHYASPTRHWRMLRHQEFDICEMSLGSYLSSRSNAENFPFTAIPVFPHRRFRHSYMFKHSDADVEDPGDFEGKKVGLRTWQATAGVWMRGISQEHYGLDLESVTWYVDDTEDVPLDLPDRFDIRTVPDGKDLEGMLVEGELSGAMYPALLDSVKTGEGAERVFSDSLAVEQSYYEETGHFPLMHAVVIRDEVLEEHPWVAVNVFQAFDEAIRVCLGKLEDPRWTALAWARQHLEHQQEVLGDNPWQCGLTDDNHRTLDKLQEYAEDQGMIPGKYDPEEIFVESTLDEEIQGKEYITGGKA